MGKRQTELPYICNLQVIKNATKNLERVGDPGHVRFTFVQRQPSYISAQWTMNAQRSLLEFFARKRQEALMKQTTIYDFFAVAQARPPQRQPQRQLTLQSAWDRLVNER